MIFFYQYQNVSNTPRFPQGFPFNPMLPAGHHRNKAETKPAFASAAPMLDPREKLRASCDSARSTRAATASSAVRKPHT